MANWAFSGGTGGANGGLAVATLSTPRGFGISSNASNFTIFVGNTATFFTVRAVYPTNGSGVAVTLAGSNITGSLDGPLNGVAATLRGATRLLATSLATLGSPMAF